MKTVLIFGGSGFIGQHIIRKIAKNGYRIIVPYQRQINEAKLRIYGNTGQIIPLHFNSLNDNNIIDLIKNADVILNCKTLWDEKKTSFEVGIKFFNSELVNIIRKNNANSQFIYFSGIGIDEKSKSKRSLSIYETEQYISTNLSNSTIMKPGIIIGGGDKFLGNLLFLVKFSFFIPLFGDGKSRFQPVFIDDVISSIDRIINNKILGNHVYELASDNVFTYRELYSYILSCLGIKRIIISIPIFLVKIAVYILDKVSLSPLNSEQLNLFTKDNVVSNKYKNLRNLDIIPQDLREKIKKIVKENI